MIENKVIMITGAARGLGSALVRAFLDQGYCVVGIGRGEDTSSVSESARYLYIQANVTDAIAVQSAVSTAISKFGRIDVLFNNAAVYSKVSFLAESAEDFALALGININGVANCCKAVLPSMIGNGFGRIYNVGSFADIAPIQNSAAYAASKGGLRGLTKGIAIDVNELNLDIEVHEWIPGHLNTRLSDFTGMAPSISAAWAVEIVRNNNASTKNCIFQNNYEWKPPQSLKQRLREKLFFWRSSL